ncbi:hypothetical protein [Streptomyces sp. NPDC005303]|uniref:hypothetical protein n=1 Tax=Streptomyces sp. NPDC005303 TaxID=3155713 RepID=UPI0033AEDE8E
MLGDDGKKTPSPVRGRVPLDAVLVRRADVPDVPGREDAGLGPDAEEAPVLLAPVLPAPLRGGDFLAGLRGAVFFAVASPEDDDFGDFGVPFLAAAFQEVPQVRQDTSVRALNVSHSGQRQSAVGRPAPPGRFAGGRGAPVFFAAGLDAEDALAAPGGLGAVLAAESRRVSPQTVHDGSLGPLNVSQSAQRQLADATTSRCLLTRHSSLVTRHA